MTSQTSHLRAEIVFWKEMIEQKGSVLSEPALERMQLALELAERKLNMLEPTLPIREEVPADRIVSQELNERRH